MSIQVKNQQDLASFLEKEHYVATVVAYERPVEVEYYAINRLLFEGLHAEIDATGEQWAVNFSVADEYRIRVQASMLAVVTQYLSALGEAFSRIQRVEESEAYLRIRPSPTVDILPGQKLSRAECEIDMESSCNGDAISAISLNALSAKDRIQIANNHTTLVYRLLSLEAYRPRLLGVAPIPIDYLMQDKIPFLK